MRNRALLLAAACVAAVTGMTAVTAATASSTPDPTVVRTADGLLRGSADGDVLRFRGIRYAQPPTGARRWAPPAPVTAWQGIRQATRSGPPCPQDGTTGTSEDCLRLDVTVPGRPAAAPRPVLVWVHGGGFSAGTGTEYDPRRLAARGNVMVVTVDFRIGVLGNLAVPGMTDGGTYGLQDQQAALRWVRRSAAAFGGDPRNVTLFGQSGGGVATCGQLTSPTARELFDKAILQSGSCATTLGRNASGPGVPATGTFWRPLSEAQRTGDRVAHDLGCTTLACLRKLPVSTLLTKTGEVTAAAYGGRTLPRDPATAPPAKPGRPVLSGHTSSEQRLIAGLFRLLGQPITAAQYPRLLREGFGADAPAVARVYNAKTYGDAESAWAAAYTDSGFVCPQLHTDDRFAAHGPVTGYEFADETAPLLIPSTPGFRGGASHASELFYLFDVKDKPIRLDGTVYHLTPAQYRVANRMIDAWSSFARTGHPGLWPQWTGPLSLVHRYTADRENLALPVLEHHCGLWRGLQR